jgi:pyruvate dehydrogenase E2 component (dihydrolipoamide acetyltransferase)
MPEPSEVSPVQGMRKIIAERMHSSLANTAQLTLHLDVDMTDAGALRKEGSQKSGVTLSTADFFMKACGEALQRHPKLNSAMVDGSIHYYSQVNIGLAVALDDGLVVPVVKDVNGKDVIGLAKERIALVDKAQNGKLLPDHMAGGTFTLTVLGSVDGFTPILNPPQSGILGVGRSVQKPVVSRGKIVVREMMTLSLTADHQVIDGAVAASFMRRLQATIERPAALLR